MSWISYLPHRHEHTRPLLVEVTVTFLHLMLLVLDTIVPWT